MQSKKTSLFKMNRRTKAFVAITFASSLLILITIVGVLIPEEFYETNFSIQGQAPSLKYLFGTDFMGRNMFWRTIKGLSISICVGLIATFASSVIAVLLGICAGVFGKKVDTAITWVVDLFLSVPHLILQILICVAFGRGMHGLMIAILLTHWPTLTRIVRSKVLSLRNSQFVQESRRLGKKPFWIAINHITPHVFPNFVVGLVLLFPHAIMHEASLTFLGFGIPPEIPAIGVILSEAMGYLTTGMWWLAVFPGLTLLAVVLLFELIGEQLRRLIDPVSGQE